MNHLLRSSIVKQLTVSKRSLDKCYLKTVAVCKSLFYIEISCSEIEDFTCLKNFFSVCLF